MFYHTRQCFFSSQDSQDVVKSLSKRVKVVNIQPRRRCQRFSKFLRENEVFKQEIRENFSHSYNIYTHFRFLTLKNSTFFLITYACPKTPTYLPKLTHEGATMRLLLTTVFIAFSNICRRFICEFFINKIGTRHYDIILCIVNGLHIFQ